MFASITVGEAQVSKLDLNAFIQETQRISRKSDEVTAILRIPEEYWWVSLAQDLNITAAIAEELKKVFSRYIVLFVLDSKTGPSGATTYTSEMDIRAKIQIKDSEGVHYYPLNENTINPESKNFLSMLKPILADILGQTEQNIHFFFFPGKNKQGQDIVEARKEGGFSVELREIEFSWKLPLQRLLVPRICPTCGEK